MTALPPQTTATVRRIDDSPSTRPVRVRGEVRRPRLAARAGAAAAVLALALTGCSGDGQDPETGAPVSTKPSPSDGARSSSSPAASGGSSGGAASTTAEPSSTEFVPASSKGPAQNVPVPEMPAEAKEQTKEGLEAALRYWWETSDYLKASGNAAPLQTVSHPGCEFCDYLIEGWPRVYENGGWVVSDPIKLVILDSQLTRENGKALYTLQVSEKAVGIYLAPGERDEQGSSSTPSKAYWSGSARYAVDKQLWQIDGVEVLRTIE